MPHQKSADRVAVKIIEKAQLDWDVKFSENLHREVEIMKNLRHPNGISCLTAVVALKDLLVTESHVGIVLE